MLSNSITEASAMKPTTTAVVVPMPKLTEGEDIDLSLLLDSLSMTPWERMLANDDALNFGDSLAAAMEKRNAQSQRTGA